MEQQKVQMSVEELILGDVSRELKKLEAEKKALENQTINKPLKPRMVAAMEAHINAQDKTQIDNIDNIVQRELENDPAHQLEKKISHYDREIKPLQRINKLAEEIKNPRGTYITVTKPGVFDPADVEKQLSRAIEQQQEQSILNSNAPQEVSVAYLEKNLDQHQRKISQDISNLGSKSYQAAMESHSARIASDPGFKNKEEIIAQIKDSNEKVKILKSQQEELYKINAAARGVKDKYQTIKVINPEDKKSLLNQSKDLQKGLKEIQQQEKLLSQSKSKGLQGM